MQIPRVIGDFIKLRSLRSGSADVCNSCNATCCSGPGFALLENVLRIYELYQSGLLKRDDYEFEGDLDLASFVYKYFDRVFFNNSLLVFFPKTFTENHRMVSIPPWNYYQAREYIQKRTEKKGCIFLAKPLDPNLAGGNLCLLHHDSLYEEISSKPLDCVFLNCSADKQVIKPLFRESSFWLSMLDYYFPDSKERFSQLCPGLPD